jgi:hypothetical protein
METYLVPFQPTNQPTVFLMANHTYSSFEEFKEQNNLLYKNLIDASNCSDWNQPIGSLNSASVLDNPGLVTDAQWGWFVRRSLSYDSLKDKSVSFLIQHFYYVQDSVSCEDVHYTVPNGNICGGLQGIHFHIDKDGVARS